MTQDFVGERFGRWTVLRFDEAIKKYRYCRCDCGKERMVGVDTLLNGRSRSCGCLKSDNLKTHGKSRTSIYDTWRTMLKRCYAPSQAQYQNYGGRGITVCPAWHSFENFYADMGDRPKGLSLDRINNDLGYGPDNCRWATQTQQIRNKRNTARVMLNGERVSLAELCEQRGLKLKRIRQRLAAGWPIEEALNPKRVSRWHRGKS